MPEEDSKKSKGQQGGTPNILFQAPHNCIQWGNRRAPEPLPLLWGRRLLATPDQEEIESSRLNAEEAKGRVALLESLKDHFWFR